jgi:hypothetical protein
MTTTYSNPLNLGYTVAQRLGNAMCKDAVAKRLWREKTCCHGLCA